MPDIRMKPVLEDEQAVDVLGGSAPSGGNPNDEWEGLARRGGIVGLKSERGSMKREKKSEIYR